ncbi:MAG TPA: NAD(+)/NADH kinase [Trebonia sp.]|nr:NAD(+)/NADH kinase [Trebonia sp.]
MISRMGLVVHGGNPAAVAAAGKVREWAVRCGTGCVDVDVWSDDPDTPRRSAAGEAAAAGYPDLVVTVGGDGTLLRGVRIAAPLGIPVLGIDCGRVGFLTDVETGEIAAALDAVNAGTVHTEKRLMLTMRASRPLEIPAGMGALLNDGRGPLLPAPAVRDGAPESRGWGVPLDVLGLNDVVFEKLARDRQASVAVYVSGRLFGYYSADAVMVSSSTGSTAYSFAAGGPVVSPHVPALVFTPVAPHMIFDRSIVLDARRERVAVWVLEHSGRVAVSVDGQLRGVLDPGDWVSVYAAQHWARLIRLRETDFLHRVRDRFGLADSPAALADGTAPEVYAPAEPIPDDIARPGPPHPW